MKWRKLSNRYICLWVITIFVYFHTRIENKTGLDYKIDHPQQTKGKDTVIRRAIS